MAIWLICTECADEDEWDECSIPTGCPRCGAPRYAEDDNGVPQVIWSEPGDYTKW